MPSQQISMTLSTADKKSYRAIGHKLKPIVTIAQKGFTDNIKSEIERALKEHELIKIKLNTSNKEEMKVLSEAICQEFGAESIQSMGHVLLLYRAAKKPDKRLSNVHRHTQD